MPQRMPNVGGTMGPPPIVVGASAAVLLFGLRVAGVVVGVVALAVAVVVVLLFPGPRRLADRLLVTAAVVLGWLPLLGWVPSLGTLVDVPGALLAVAFGVVTGDRFRRRQRNEPGRRATVRAPDLLAWAVGQGVAAWWAYPFAMQRRLERFALLIQGWDHGAHVSFLLMNIRLGSFITTKRHAATGDVVFGHEYPQGVHQVWAQWARLWDPTPAVDPTSLLDLYLVMLVATMGVAAGVACMGVARLFRSEATGAFPLMAAVVQVVTVGVLSIGVWLGFPNFTLAVACVATASALLLRPRPSPVTAFVAVSGLFLVGAYNWLPIAPLGAPPLVAVTVQLWKAAGTPGRRLGVVLACIATAVALAGPIIVTVHLGSDLALAHGGMTPLPRFLFVAATAGLGAAVAVRAARTGERAVSWALGAVALAGSASVVAVVAYQVSAEGRILYYGEKLATGVTAACLIGLALVVGEALAASRPGAPRRPSPAAAVLVAVALLQLTGYVGPAWRTLGEAAAAPGFRVHEEWTAPPDPRTEAPLRRLLATADGLARLPDSSPDDAAKWTYIDIDRAEPQPMLADGWVAGLVGQQDAGRVRRAGAILHLHAPHVVNVTVAADVMSSTVYPEIADPALRLVVPDDLARELVARGAPWTNPGLLWVLDGLDVRPVVG